MSNSTKVGNVTAAESLRFVRKDATKIPLVLGMYAASIGRYQESKTLRAAYFFARHIDDVLDGELIVSADPVGYAEDLRAQIVSGQYRSLPKIARLAAYAMPRLEASGRPKDNPRAEMVTLIDAMIFDYSRRVDRQALSQEALDGYYKAIINPSLNLLMITFGGTLRAADIPEYAPNLGRLYSIRDLKKDWRLGIINIPASVLIDNQLNTNDAYSAVTRSEGIQDWTTSDTTAATQELATVTAILREQPASFPNKVVLAMIQKATH